MRTIIILSAFIGGVSLASCSKKYSCKCTTTIQAQYYYPYNTETVVHIEKRVTKKKAEKICANTAIQLRENTKEIIHGWDIGAKCELKDY